MKNSYAAAAIILAMACAGLSADALAWGKNNGNKATCASIGPPHYTGKEGWVAGIVHTPDKCTWTKVVADDSLPGKPSCHLDASFDRMQPAECKAKLTVTFSGPTKPNACEHLFKHPAIQTAAISERVVCNNK